MKTTPTRKKKKVVWGVWLTVWVMVTGSATGVGMVESQRLLFDSHQGPILDQEATALLSAASSAQSQSPNLVSWVPRRWDMAPTSSEQLSGSIPPIIDCSPPVSKADKRTWILLSHTNADKQLVHSFLKGLGAKREETLCFKFDSRGTERVGKCQTRELLRSPVESSAISCPCQALDELHQSLSTDFTEAFLILIDAVGADSSTCSDCDIARIKANPVQRKIRKTYLHNTGTTQTHALRTSDVLQNVNSFKDLPDAKPMADTMLKDTIKYSEECHFPPETEDLKCKTVGGKKECTRTDNGDCHICKPPKLVKPDEPDFKTSQANATCPASQLCVPCNPFICPIKGGSPKEVLTKTDPVPWTCNPKRENRIYILIDPNSFQQKWKVRLGRLLDDVAKKTTPEKDFSVTTISLATFDNPTHPIHEEPAIANLKKAVEKIKNAVNGLAKSGNPACYCSGLWSLLETLDSTLPTSHVIMVADTETPPDPQHCHDVPINCQHTLYDLDLHNVHLYVWSKGHKPTNNKKLFNIRKQDRWINMADKNWIQENVNSAFHDMMVCLPLIGLLSDMGGCDWEVPECVTGWCVYDMAVERCSGGYGRRGTGECGVSDVPGLFHFHRARPESALSRLRPICAPMRQPCHQQSDECTKILEQQEEDSGDEVLKMKVISAKRDLGMTAAVTLVVVSAGMEKELRLRMKGEIKLAMETDARGLYLPNSPDLLTPIIALVPSTVSQKNQVFIVKKVGDLDKKWDELEKALPPERPPSTVGTGASDCVKDGLKAGLAHILDANLLPPSKHLPIHVPDNATVFCGYDVDISECGMKCKTCGSKDGVAVSVAWDEAGLNLPIHSLDLTPYCKLDPSHPPCLPCPNCPSSSGQSSRRKRATSSTHKAKVQVQGTKVAYRLLVPGPGPTTLDNRLLASLKDQLSRAPRTADATQHALDVPNAQIFIIRDDGTVEKETKKGDDSFWKAAGFDAAPPTKPLRLCKDYCAAALDFCTKLDKPSGEKTNLLVEIVLMLEDGCLGTCDKAATGEAVKAACSAKYNTAFSVLALPTPNGAVFSGKVGEMLRVLDQVPGDERKTVRTGEPNRDTARRVPISSQPINGGGMQQGRPPVGTILDILTLPQSSVSYTCVPTGGDCVPTTTPNNCERCAATWTPVLQSPSSSAFSVSLPTDLCSTRTCVSCACPTTPGTVSQASTESTDSTGSTGSTDSTGSTGSTGSTDSTGSTVGAGSTTASLTADPNDTTKVGGLAWWWWLVIALIILLLLLILLLLTLLCIRRRRKSVMVDDALTQSSAASPYSSFSTGTTQATPQPVVVVTTAPVPAYPDYDDDAFTKDANEQTDDMEVMEGDEGAGFLFGTPAYNESVTESVASSSRSSNLPSSSSSNLP